MYAAERVRLKISKDQEVSFLQNAGCSRKVYNELLALSIWLYKNYKVSLNMMDKTYLISGMLNIKYPYLKNVESSSLRNACINLDQAFKRFFDGVSSFPRFKSKNREKKSFKISINNDNIHFDDTLRYLKIPKIGWVKVVRPKKVFDRLNRIKNVINSVTISQDSDQNWYASIGYECNNQTPLPKTGINSGVDVGITNHATVSMSNDSGQVIDLPTRLQKLERLRKRWSKLLSRRVFKSKNWEKARIRLAKIYFDMKNLRKNFNHQLSWYLVKYSDTISMETLDIKGMLASGYHKFNNKVANGAWYQLRSFTEYKCMKYDRTFVSLDKWFSSSKICSECGMKNEFLSRNDKSWTCLNCGSFHDRDINASRNIQRFGSSKISETEYDYQIEVWNRFNSRWNGGSLNACG